MKHSYVLTALLLGSCSFGLDPLAPPGEQDADVDADADTDTDSDADAEGDADVDAAADVDADTDADGTIEINSLSPAWGTTAGGDEITLTGGEFNSSTEITFDGEPADVRSRSSDEIVVETPSYDGVPDAIGKAEVEVAANNDDGSDGVADDPFTYYLDGTGKAGAIGAIEWYHYNGGYWTGGGDFGAANITFITPPVDMHYWDFYAGATDDCADDTYDVTDTIGDVYVLDMGVSSIALTYGSQRVNLYWDDTYGAYINSSDLTSSQVPTEQLYDLAEVDGTFAPEPFTVTGFAKSGAAFTVSSPSINGSTIQNVMQNSLQFRWSGGSGRRILISMVVLDQSTGTTRDSLNCVVNDDGEFTVPSGEWGGTWPARSYLYMYIGNVVENGDVLPYNNADTRIAGIYWNVGVGNIP